MFNYLIDGLKFILYFVLSFIKVLTSGVIGWVVSTIFTLYVIAHLTFYMFPCLKGPLPASGVRPNLKQVVMQAKKDAAKFNRNLAEDKRRERQRRAQDAIRQPINSQVSPLQGSKQIIQQHNLNHAQEKALEGALLQLQSKRP